MVENNVKNKESFSMKMIKPIVNLSKITDAYDAVLCGFNGVLHDGVSFIPEAVKALAGLYKNNKKIVILSNTACRVEELADKMHRAGVSPRLLTAAVTAGEILHYGLSSGQGAFAGLGKNYFNLGEAGDVSVFQGLGYAAVSDPAKADFLYIGSLPAGRSAEDYIDVLSHAASLGLPLLCAGNDTSVVAGEEVVAASGAVAEQYAVLGGRIITAGKPDARVVDYALAAFGDIDRKRILLIGDNMASDIRAAAAAGISGCLVSKGIHSGFLGEGYIPDVTKTRELGNMLEACPDYVISKLRW